MEEKGRI